MVSYFLQVLLEEMSTAPCPAMSKPVHLARAANRLRQSNRPADPTSIDFDLREDVLPENFLRADITTRNGRHLIFASDEQLNTLREARTWYIDGTFKLVRRPFQQLLSVNAFVRKEECAKQVPLVFVLMSGRRKNDYKKVQDLGLTHAYTADEGTFSYIRRLMALPFIPFQEIPAVFQTLAVEAATEPLQELVGYISTNWITSTIFPPRTGASKARR
ncbi:uncharacterized protein LOC122947722 isoform X2 [Acropora millepora]|uniref:uncharacterized protein LOC122947722 isoform X2 n=1 Tax=Acropora millepora TaxID=45264 RepID=UPI001CF31771|nr:uncharacterized protein LOC122947722 isoform X2 [Acropora millepora]